MKRQALIIDIKKIKQILQDIEESDKELSKELNQTVPSHKFIIPIKNIKGLSDTWEIE